MERKESSSPENANGDVFGELETGMENDDEVHLELYFEFGANVGRAGVTRGEKHVQGNF